MADEAGGGRVRLFVALELPAPLVRVLLRWREAVVEEHAPRLRPVPAESLHLTLCFLGPQPAPVVSDISAACARAAEAGVPVLELGQAVWLPRRRPRVLGVTVGDAEHRLSELQGSMSAVLTRGGFYRPERRPFLAHVTVARARGRAERLGGPLPPVPAARGPGGRVTLFRSHLSASGARYERLWSSGS